MEESLNEKVIKIYVDGDVGLVWNNEGKLHFMSIF